MINILETNKIVVIKITIMDEARNVITMIEKVIATVIIVENTIINITIMIKNKITMIETVMISITAFTSMTVVNLGTDCLQKIGIRVRIALTYILQCII
jgi:hypothetical protein